jgi:hypothetical protein
LKIHVACYESYHPSSATPRRLRIRWPKGVAPWGQVALIDKDGLVTVRQNGPHKTFPIPRSSELYVDHVTRAPLFEAIALEVDLIDRQFTFKIPT